MSQKYTRRIQTIVIGGGQAGLAAGYHLARRGLSFVIVDSGPRVGDAWRNRWDSLRLFTPARYNALPGLTFPARGDNFPTKDEMADYLESYAKHFHLPVQTGVRARRLSKEGERFVIEADSLRFEAQNVVVAMANYQAPRFPVFAKDLDPSIRQLHAHSYPSANPQAQIKEAKQAANAKAEVQKRGVGEQSRVRVSLHNGTEIKGHIGKVENNRLR